MATTMRLILGLVACCVLLRGAAASLVCDDVAPRRFPVSCDEFRASGHCARNTQLACRKSCGLCLSSQDEKAVTSLANSHCARKVQRPGEPNYLSEDALKGFITGLRAARAGIKAAAADGSPGVAVAQADLASLLTSDSVLEAIRQLPLEW